MPDNEHEACVDHWLARAGRGVPLEPTVDLFERGLAAVWLEAHLTLGEITLRAIVRRVLHVGAERFPALALLRAEDDGVSFAALRGSREADEHEVRAAMRFILVEFLTVLGNLTGEILSPHLRKRLSRVAPPAPSLHDEAAPGAGQGRGSGEGRREEAGT